MVIFPATEYVIEIDTLDNWQNTHISSLTHVVRAIVFRGLNRSPLNFLPRWDGKPEAIPYPWQNRKI